MNFGPAEGHLLSVYESIYILQHISIFLLSLHQLFLLTSAYKQLSSWKLPLFFEQDKGKE